MVSHAGEHGRTFQEVKRIGAELALLSEKVADTPVEQAEAAVLLDWNAWWASQQEGRLSSDVDFPQVVRAWHRALWEAHTTADFAHPEHDLTAYKLVVVPQLYLMTDTAIDNLVAYVENGGTLVAGFQTGVADQDDRVREGGMDARLRALFGIRTLHEWWPHDPGETVDVEGFYGTLWSEELEAADDADAVTPYKGGELDGLPAVLRRGRAWYLSTLPEPHALRVLLADIAADAGARPTLDGLPADVEAVRRGGLLFLLNHGRDGVTVPVPGRHRDLLTGADAVVAVELGRYGVAVLEPVLESAP
jgi:beta-galactosidase